MGTKKYFNRWYWVCTFYQWLETNMWQCSYRCTIGYRGRVLWYFWFEKIIALMCLPTALCSRSRDRSWSRSEWTVLAGVGVGAEVGKMMPTPTPVQSRGLTACNRRWFWTNGFACPKNIERQEERERPHCEVGRYSVHKRPRTSYCWCIRCSCTSI